VLTRQFNHDHELSEIFWGANNLMTLLRVYIVDMASLTIRRILLLIIGIAVAIATGIFTGVLGMVM
jgi:hypothetical protein